MTRDNRAGIPRITASWKPWPSGSRDRKCKARNIRRTGAQLGPGVGSTHIPGPGGLNTAGQASTLPPETASPPSTTEMSQQALAGCFSPDTTKQRSQELGSFCSSLFTAKYIGRGHYIALTTVGQSKAKGRDSIF